MVLKFLPGEANKAKVNMQQLNNCNTNSFKFLFDSFQRS